MSSTNALKSYSGTHPNFSLAFYGKGNDEKAIVKACTNTHYQLDIGKEVLSIDPNYYRPTEVDYLVGDPTKAKEKLGWVPEYDFNTLVDDMMESDLKLFSKK
jgi:GDPmannose 4,6-dehydratase